MLFRSDHVLDQVDDEMTVIAEEEELWLGQTDVEVPFTQGFPLQRRRHRAVDAARLGSEQATGRDARGDVELVEVQLKVRLVRVAGGHEGNGEAQT